MFKWETSGQFAEITECISGLGSKKMTGKNQHVLFKNKTR